ncbi:hypothetical protein O0L34_g5833 [Tuta absoluta]|nr:hypothetical protein O0L34_g5833 [Tuta absoluta]
MEKSNEEDEGDHTKDIENLNKNSDKKPKRIHMNRFDPVVDYMNFDENFSQQLVDNLSKTIRQPYILATSPSKLRKATEEIPDPTKKKNRKHRSRYYGSYAFKDRKRQRHEKIQTPPPAYIEPKSTAVFVAEDELIKNVKVYTKKTSFREKNGRHILPLWTQNHHMPSGNTIVDGRNSPVNMWYHTIFRPPRPTPPKEFDEDTQGFDDFERRKRGMKINESCIDCGDGDPIRIYRLHSFHKNKLHQNELEKQVEATVLLVNTRDEFDG